MTKLLWLNITSNQSTQLLRQPHDGTVQRSGRLYVSRVNTLPSATGRSRGYRPLCCLTPAPRITRRGESGLGPYNLGISVPTAPSHPRPLGKASDSLIPLRLARDPPEGPRTNCSCSASPEAGLLPQPRRLRLKRRSGKLSHPINAPSCTHYISHDRQCTTIEATGQRSNLLFSIPR